jgi:meiotically up-regulated gene 157 (Mug157) protein
MEGRERVGFGQQHLPEQAVWHVGMRVECSTTEKGAGAQPVIVIVGDSSIPNVVGYTE